MSYISGEGCIILSGKRSFCLELFKQVVMYLSAFTKTPLFLNKALFYVDFKHFQLHGVGITGTRYIHLEYGPCPDQYQNLLQLFLSKGILESGKNHTLKSIEKPDLSVFSDTEKEVLAMVANLAARDGGKKLLKFSHEEEAFLKTKSMQLISYKYSKELKV